MVLEVPIQDLVGTNDFGPLSMAAIMAGCVGKQTTHLIVKYFRYISAEIILKEENRFYIFNVVCEMSKCQSLMT
jgi:hypothetical protein